MRHVRRRRLVRFQSSTQTVHIRLGARAWLAMGLIAGPVANSPPRSQRNSRRTRSVDRGGGGGAGGASGDGKGGSGESGAGSSGADTGGAVAGREVEARTRTAPRRPSPGRWRAAISGWGAPGHLDSVLRRRPWQRDALAARSPRLRLCGLIRRVRDRRGRSDERGPDYWTG